MRKMDFWKSLNNEKIYCLEKLDRLDNEGNGFVENKG